jgi:CPA2 family monovalent cation:H+ antiporter-2
MCGMAAEVNHQTLTLIELGAAFLGLSIAGRISSRFGISPIPLYLLSGLAFGKGGLAPLDFSFDFIDLGADIGVLLLLFMLGLEYSGKELKDNLQQNASAGIMDFLLNFPPGFILGLLLKWPILAAVLMGGVTWVSSSGIIAKLIHELKRSALPETKSIMAVLVLEDLAMAVFLPVTAALIAGGTLIRMGASVVVAVLTVLMVLLLAIKFGDKLSKILSHQSDEIILLTTFGLVLLVAGIAQRLNVSEAVGAFLVGIALSGPIAKQSNRIFAPLRDLFAATFFFFFGLEVNPTSLPPVMLIALALAIVSGGTKVLTGWLASKNTAIDSQGRWRAGATMIARGEFSIVIAGLGIDIEPQMGAVAAAYVLLLAIAGPIAARFTK